MTLHFTSPHPRTTTTMHNPNTHLENELNLIFTLSNQQLPSSKLNPFLLSLYLNCMCNCTIRELQCKSRTLGNSVCVCEWWASRSVRKPLNWAFAGIILQIRTRSKNGMNVCGGVNLYLYIQSLYTQLLEQWLSEQAQLLNTPKGKILWDKKGVKKEEKLWQECESESDKKQKKRGARDSSDESKNGLNLNICFC